MAYNFLLGVLHECVLPRNNAYHLIHFNTISLRKTLSKNYGLMRTLIEWSGLVWTSNASIILSSVEKMLKSPKKSPGIPLVIIRFTRVLASVAKKTLFRVLKHGKKDTSQPLGF